MTREQLTSIQSERLQKTVRDAFHKVPFYGRLYRQAGVDVENIANVSDLIRLPRLTRIDFQGTPLQNRTAKGADVNACALGSTSGTTGTPLTVLEDSYSAAYREALMIRFLWAYGVRPSDKIARGGYVSGGYVGGPVHQATLAERQSLWGLLRRRYVKQRFFIDFDDQLAFLSKCKPDVLIAFSSYCKALARHCEQIDHKLNFRIVVTAGDVLDESTRELIAKCFQAEVFDNYGIEEVGGSIAWECPTHSGYHINSDSLVLEFLRDGEPAAAGEDGDLYVTCFHRKATPIIRYFAGDVARSVAGDCPCGRGLPLMTGIQGRVLDYILTVDGRHVSPHYVLEVLTEAYGVEQFKVTQKKDLSVEVRIMTGMNEAEPILRDVRQRCRELFDKTPLDVKLVDKIDTAGQKFRTVESLASS
jgi:phenylacetate-CoA ligase